MNTNASNVGKSISEKVIGCAFEVSNRLGSGFLEAVYQKALAVELAVQNIGFEREKSMVVNYRDKEVGHYIADFVIEDRLLVELKALSGMTGEHEAQVMNYLKATEQG